MSPNKFEDLADLVVSEGERGALRQIIDATDAVYYRRHPDHRGKKLDKQAEGDRQTEWSEIFRTQTRLAMTALGLDARLIDIGA